MCPCMCVWALPVNGFYSAGACRMGTSAGLGAVCVDLVLRVLFRNRSVATLV